MEKWIKGNISTPTKFKELLFNCRKIKKNMITLKKTTLKPTVLGAVNPKQECKNL